MILSLASKRLLLLSSRGSKSSRSSSRSSLRSISTAGLTITKATDENSRFANKPPKEKLTFGTTLSDHMLTIAYDHGEWQAPQIRPYGNLEISPAASSLHYGLSCFEGMKAYKEITTSSSDDSNDGTATTTTIRLFRPDMNMARLKASMRRLQMPGTDFDEDALLTLLMELLKVDDRWIPEGDGYSLYIRPTVIATHPYLGLAAPTDLLLYIITSPVGPYYPTGFQPITLLATPDYVRAWPGGTGCNKVGGNYGPTMKPQAEAAKAGYSQVLWLFGDDATEVGGMNIFFVLEGDDGRDILVTPPLDRGDILPGVTRDSILTLAAAAENGLTIEERFPTMTELKEAAACNRLKEAFGTGTAAVVTPINGIHMEGDDIVIPATGKWTQHFWDQLTGIQCGRLEGPEGWSVVVK